MTSSTPGRTTRCSRPVTKSETTTRSPEISVAPPPYSSTRLRALNPSGVIRVCVPSFSRRISTCRPPSSGRPSSHHVTPPIALDSLRKTTRSVSRSIRNGDAHAPNGAVMEPELMRPSLGPVLPRRDVLGLLRGHRVERDPECRKLEACHLGIDRDRHRVHALLELAVVLRDVLGGQRL